jgi:hypothetical protein
LRIVKRDDAKIEPEMMISPSDLDNHMHLLHVLLHTHQLQGCPLSGWSTHQVATSPLPFSAFPLVNEGYARIIRDLVLRLQSSTINFLRNETSQGYGKAVCGKNKRSVG